VKGVVSISGLRLRYRRLNQAEIWQVIEMEKPGDDFRAVITAEYTNSPFPLQYYFQVRSVSGERSLFPNLERKWQGQPYYVVRQA
jgi:hypothetical protein